MDERKETGSGTRSFPRTGLTGQKSFLVSCSRVSNKCISRARLRLRAARFYEAIKARTCTLTTGKREKAGRTENFEEEWKRGGEERNVPGKNEAVRTRPCVFPSFILLAIDKCVIAREEHSDWRISSRAKVGRAKGRNERNVTFVSDPDTAKGLNCKPIVSKLLDN